ncbi:hypothetical protein Pmani_002230 [Petrolisthes manimaculis]|uniref:Reverse transcriptase domain-containing protein n=1 Tax=Petrolisthes manimaculis TaxID=1843537 RepID=A0AAE1UR73_9EUCA|nr:hypothetical protein Pmani_002230 [Petrolisthes manimaculis]
MNLSLVFLVTDFGSSDEAVTYFTDVLHSAALNSFLKTSGYFPKRPVPWWSPVCTTAVREKRAAFSHLRRNRGDPTLLEDFRWARARARRVLKEARRASWKAYVSSINSKTPLTQVFKRVRKMAGKFSPSSPPVLKVNGVQIMDSLTVANTMAEAFARVSSRDSRPLAVRHELRAKERTALNFSGNENESYNHIFTLRDLHSALSLCGNTSPGPDNIPYAMLRHLGEEAILFLFALYNRIWVEGVFPSGWRVATILPFPKPCKDSSVALNYRPIALTSCLCKLFEKMVNVRLVYFLERGDFLSPSQSGFRKHRSTTDSLVRLEAAACEAFARHQHLVCVFFDLEKAYDTTWQYGILQQLHVYGLQGRLSRFLKEFLSGRSFSVRVGTALSASVA